MSNLQFGTLKYILTHNVTVDDVNGLNLTTFGSLAAHGWVARKGHRIVGTRKGEEAYGLYHYAMCNYRQHAAAISDRVRTLLHIGELRMLKQAAPAEAISKAG